MASTITTARSVGTPRSSRTPRKTPVGIIEIPTADESNIDHLASKFGSLASMRTDRTGNTYSTDYDYYEKLLLEESENEETPRPKKLKPYEVELSDGTYTYVDMTPPEDLLSDVPEKVKTFVNRGKPDMAVRELGRCVALTMVVYGYNHWRLADAYSKLAAGYLNLRSCPQQAILHCEKARSIILTGVNQSETLEFKPEIMGTLINIYFTLGRALMAQKKYSEAERHLLKAEKVADERSQFCVVDTEDTYEWDVRIFSSIGKLFLLQKKFDASERFFAKTIDLIVKGEGEDSERLIKAYQDAGRACQDSEKSINMFLQAHSVAAVNYPGDTEETANTGMELAKRYIRLNTPEGDSSATSYLTESLSMSIALFGMENAKTLEVYNEIVMVKARNPDTAEEACNEVKELIKYQEFVYGELSKETAESYKLFGSIRLSQGQLERAVKHFKRCLAIQTEVYGREHKETRSTQKTVDMLMQTPQLASKFSSTPESKLKARPDFRATVGRSKPVW